jgi:arylformamidase
MKLVWFFVFASCLAPAFAQEIRRNVPYLPDGNERQMLDIYSPRDATGLPVVFWLHGGGWQAGDKSDVKLKPQWFMDRGIVFVSTNYRLLPKVDMGTLVGDVARAVGWMHRHIAEYGGDPKRVLVGGHSAGAQLAALICTDERYLRSEGVTLGDLIGCVPVDGDTYDIPAIIETAETRWRVHGMPPAKFGHREKFGNDPEKFKAFSAVTHVSKGKGIPPFLILHVAEHPDTSAQAFRLASVLKEAGVAVTVFGAKDTSHVRLNDNLGLPEDQATRVLDEFVGKVMKTWAGRRTP